MGTQDLVSADILDGLGSAGGLGSLDTVEFRDGQGSVDIRETPEFQDGLGCPDGQDIVERLDGPGSVDGLDGLGFLAGRACPEQAGFLGQAGTPELADGPASPGSVESVDILEVVYQAIQVLVAIVVNLDLVV